MNNHNTPNTSSPPLVPMLKGKINTSSPTQAKVGQNKYEFTNAGQGQNIYLLRRL